MTDLDPYIEQLRCTFDEMVEATDPELRDALRDAINANREVRAQHESDLLAIQEQINRRAAAFGEGLEQAMRLAADLDHTGR